MTKTTYKDADSLHRALLDATVLRQATLRAVMTGRARPSIIVTERDGTEAALSASESVLREASDLFDRSMGLVQKIAEHLRRKHERK